MRSRKRLIIGSIMFGLIILGALVSVVFVLAAQLQNVSSNVQVTYQSSEVGGRIEFSYARKGEAFSAAKVAEFDGSETTSSGGELSPDAAISLSSSQDYAVFRYKITGYAENGFYVSLEYKDMLEVDKNLSISYALSVSELAFFDNFTNAVSVGTITKNNHYGDEATIYLYVKVAIKSLNFNMSYDGDFNLVLSRAEWLDTNHDSSTGIDYGYVQNTDGTPYAAAVGYSGTADEITVDTTSVYGSEMPVVVIEDGAFATAAAATASSVALRKITIGDSVQTIGNNAFANNTSLTEVVIGNSVNSLSGSIFKNCTALTKIINNSKVTIDKQDFDIEVDVDLKNPLLIKADAKTYNNRTYYYVEMGEYPQTFAGYASNASVASKMTDSGEDIYLDIATPTSEHHSTYEQNIKYDVYKNSKGERFIKYNITLLAEPMDTWIKRVSLFSDNTVAVLGEAFFKLEPLKWDVVGYYADENKSQFVKVDDAEFDPYHKTNIIVNTRAVIQAMPWNVVNTDVNYNNSTVYSWLQSFDDKVLSEYSENIIPVLNTFNNTASTTTKEHNGNGGSVTENVWIYDYNQVQLYFSSDPELRATASDFAVATHTQMFFQSYGGTIESIYTSTYILRSSFKDGDYIRCATINMYGVYGDNNNPGYINYTYHGVRPAMMINADNYLY